MTEATEKHFKPGDKVIVRKVELPEGKQYMKWPFDDSASRVGVFKYTQGNAAYEWRTHAVSLEVDGDTVDFNFNFWDEEIELFEPEKFDGAGVTAAKNIAYDAIYAAVEDSDMDAEAEGFDAIAIAEFVVEYLKEAGVEFPDTLVDPHALSGAWGKISDNYGRASK